ncbi:MAG TPA: LytR C-terminal domain-containing protein [Gaiellaceae bacterium]|nr:LytR C-terminal domain-containing protein [Gaiellaceae bacterium]
MDHPLAPTDALVRPWRTAAVVASAIAFVELLLLVVIGGGVLMRSVSDRLQLAATEKVVATAEPEATAAKPSKRKLAPAIPAAKRPRARVTVLVLNGNGRSGAAASAASRVSRRGYRVGAVGNAPRSDFRRSLVMYKPGFAGEGHRLAKELGVAMVGPLDGMRAKDLGKAHVVFILGS